MAELDNAKASVVRWLSSGDTGISSEFLAHSFLLGKAAPKERWFDNYPHDPDDFGRCYRLVVLNPQVKTIFPTVRETCLEWRRIIDHWDEIEKLFLEESQAPRAPKCYALMRGLIEKDNPRYAFVIRRAAD